MSLGKQKRNNKVLKAFALKIKTKDLPAPVFQVKERQGDKFDGPETSETAVSGVLIGVEPKETKWEGKTIKSVNLTLTDKDQIYFLTVPYSSLGRGLMNSLLSLTSFNDVEISLYQTKPKTDGGKTYPGVALRQNGEIVRWKFSQAELPPATEITFKGEKMRDFTATENFFAAQLLELGKLVKASVPVQQETEAVTSTTPVENSNEDGEEVAF